MNLREPSPPFVFIPMRQPRDAEPRVTLAVASAAPNEPMAVLPSIRGRIAGIDPRLLISEVITIRRQLDSTLLTERLLSGLSGAFGALALILASIGLYGVLSYRVGQQRQSIGIRMALGAAPFSVAFSVLRQSGLVVAAGSFAACRLPFLQPGRLIPCCGGSSRAIPRSTLWESRCCAWPASRAPGCRRDALRDRARGITAARPRLHASRPPSRVDGGMGRAVWAPAVPPTIWRAFQSGQCDLNTAWRGA